MKEFWDQRYANADYAYGESPNSYLKSKLSLLSRGKILFPAEGEGRNAVYAAEQGWNVFAFDISKEGKNKALSLAEKRSVHIEYEVAELSELKYEAESFDAIALIYAHFPANKKSEYHKIINSWLKPGGTIIFEAFSKEHLKFNSVNEKAGGPKDPEMLYTIEEIKKDFPNYEFSELEHIETELHEGLYHNGLSAVVRFMAKKTM